MSQAAPPTNPAPARVGPSVRWLVLVAVASVAAVALAGGPQAWAYWGEQTHHVRLHAPRWELLARVWRTHPVVILHLGCALAALGIGTALLIGVKGSRAHRSLGYAWCACMLATAVSSFWIRTSGQFSFIHFLSGWVTIAVPLGLAAVAAGRCAGTRA